MKEENNKDCFFCKIVNKEILSNIVDENVYVFVFLDISLALDGYILVIFKKYCIDLVYCDELYLKEIIFFVKKVADIIESFFLKLWGFNFLSN